MNIKGKKIIFFVLVVLFSSCDFTPKVNYDILLAQKLIEKQQFEKSISQYKKILKANPSNDLKVKIYFQLGEIYSIHIGDYQKSTFYYNQIKQISTDPLWIVKTEEKLAEIYYSFLKNYDKSSESYLSLYLFKPKLDKFDFYHFFLGKSYQKGKKLDKSLAVFKDIINSKNHNFYIASFFEAGMIYYLKKDWKNAIQYWQEYIKIEQRRDSVINAKFLIANAYETLENLKEAYNIYYSILGEYPNTEVIKNRLNSIYNRRLARKR